MKEIIFTEEQLRDLGGIGMELFRDEKDPRSPAYVRILKRPRISWGKIIFFLVGTIFFLAAMVGGLLALQLPVPGIVLITVGVSIVHMLIHLKRGCICCIRIYQRFAPDRIRNKCRFEPSCSEYMLLSIEKYGLLKGARRGVQRLKRCNIDHGGYDFP